MAHQVIWTKVIMERFISEGALTRTQEHILRLRCSGMTRTEISMTLNVSLSTIDRTVKQLKRIYDEVQKYDCVLPPRKFSLEELYLDTH